MSTKGNTSGFTLVEILFVVAIIAILSAISVAVFYNIQKTAALKVSTQEVYTSLTNARNKTLGSEDDTVFGIHIATSSVTRFVGATYSPAAPTNVTYTFYRNIVATSSLSGGVTEIFFDRLSGTPNATGTITFTSAAGDATSTLTVYASGLIE